MDGTMLKAIVFEIIFMLVPNGNNITNEPIKKILLTYACFCYKEKLYLNCEE